MSVLPQETAVTDNAIDPEITTVPDDYRIGSIYGPKADPEDPTVIEAYWGGEAKVSAEVDYFLNTANIESIGRPGFWGEDVRPPQDQRREYELALDGIMRAIIDNGVNAIEVNDQQGVIADALMNVRVPEGWSRALRLYRYNTWVEGEIIDLREAVGNGAVIEVRFAPDGATAQDAGQAALRVVS